ncbi:MAG: hypothetical protein J0M12_02295 [Deltaproteobacteria bacterium]|nr:hypothetical protein [Deltaproteobacteria bacterium]
MRSQLRNLVNPVLVGAFASSDDALGAYHSVDSAGSQIFRFNDAVTPSDAAVSACRNTLARADVKASEIDFVISCTQTPDFNNPGLVSCLLAKLGGLHCPGIELRQMSVGPLYGLDLAEKLIRTRQARSVLVACTDLLSRYFANFDSHATVSEAARSARSVFADGSASFLVVDQEQSQYRQNSDTFFVYKGGKLGATAVGRETLWCKLPSARQFPMRITAADVREGRHYPELSVQGFEAAIANSALPFNFDGASCAVTHQVFDGMTEILCRKLQVSNLRFYDVFAKRGHIGAAGLPLAMSQLPRCRKGDMVTLATIGAGISWGYSRLEAL